MAHTRSLSRQSGTLLRLLLPLQRNSSKQSTVVTIVAREEYFLLYHTSILNSSAMGVSHRQERVPHMRIQVRRNT